MNHNITQFLNPRSHEIRGKYAPVVGFKKSWQICPTCWIQEVTANMLPVLESRSTPVYCQRFLDPRTADHLHQVLGFKNSTVYGFLNPRTCGSAASSWIQQLAVKLPRVLGFKNSYKGNGQVLESENSTVQTDKLVRGTVAGSRKFGQNMSRGQDCTTWTVLEVRWLVATSRDERDQRSQQVVKYVNGTREVALGVPEHEKRLLTGRMDLKMYWFFRGKVVAK
ncbi:hypothetical protein C8R43DRAFT_958979 [Mycena crocata]|nr:hypothetical protein C8R43DRAFT_958979 [Mycena crocata]